jgi:hypothetical protein
MFSKALFFGVLWSFLIVKTQVLYHINTDLSRIIFNFLLFSNYGETKTQGARRASREGDWTDTDGQDVVDTARLLAATNFKFKISNGQLGEKKEKSI